MALSVQRPESEDARKISSNIQGVLWALLSTALFAVTAAMAKEAVEKYHLLQILFFRQVVIFISSLPSISTSFPASLKTQFFGLHCLRLIGAFVALSCNIWALAVLPLATAITLGFAQIFFVTLIAMRYLDESVTMHRIVAVLVGFIGVVIVMRPGVDGIVDTFAFIPIVGAFGAAIAMTSVRQLSQTESTATLLVYQAVVVGVLAGLPLFWLWVTPDLMGLLFLLTMGIIAACANWIGVKALRLGEATVVGNMQYAQIVYAALLGFIVFNEVPDRYTVLGAAIIIGSSIYMLQRESGAKK